MQNLVSTFEHRANEFPDKTAIIFQEKHFTFSQVTTIVNKVASALRALGIQKDLKAEIEQR